MPSAAPRSSLSVTRVVAAMKEIKYPIEGVTPHDLTRMAEAVVQHEFEDPLDAIDYVYRQIIRDEEMVTPQDIDYLDIGDAFDEIEATPASVSSEEDREQRAAHAGAAAPAGAETGRGTGQGPGTRPSEQTGRGGEAEPVSEVSEPGTGGKPGEPVTEPGAEGKPQFVLPGTEQVSSAELAKRRAAERLKPKVAQRPTDEGLFGDESQQTDLADLTRKPPPKVDGGFDEAAFDAREKTIKRVASKRNDAYEAALAAGVRKRQCMKSRELGGVARGSNSAMEWRLQRICAGSGPSRSTSIPSAGS
jgi:hypothetical protein